MDNLRPSGGARLPEAKCTSFVHVARCAPHAGLSTLQLAEATPDVWAFRQDRVVQGTVRW
jgi:hypothetical protein